MKKISTGIFLVIYLLLNYTNSNSQGIKVDFLGFNGVAQNYGTPLFWGIGYEQNFGEKISLGLTYRSGYSFDSENSYSDVEYGFSIPNGNVSFTVFHNCTWSEFAYTSKYFFSDNSDGSYYVASGISMMQTTVQYDLNNLQVNGISDPTFYGDLSEGIYKQDITLFPVSIDLGHRGEFDGLFYDYYIGLGFLPFGANPDAEPASLASHGVEPQFASLSFRFGMTFGVSWAR